MSLVQIFFGDDTDSYPNYDPDILSTFGIQRNQTILRLSLSESDNDNEVRFSSNPRQTGEVSWSFLGKTVVSPLQLIRSTLLQSQSKIAASPAVPHHLHWDYVQRPSAPQSPQIYQCPTIHLVVKEQIEGVNEILEDLVEEISRLRKEIEPLERGFPKQLNQTIDSDTLLLEFTEKIFQLNSTRVDQKACSSSTIFGVRYEPMPTSLDFGASATYGENLLRVRNVPNTMRFFAACKRP
ncbi:hypothetical protein J6590_072485 [Homalodisca vitripennis]|nr:hypothetical protein J6590_072485 [Homalodisca vitripennis]